MRYDTIETLKRTTPSKSPTLISAVETIGVGKKFNTKKLFFQGIYFMSRMVWVLFNNN